MLPTYESWIKEYVAGRKGRELVGLCGAATRSMVAAFPELCRVAGWCNEREHFWCETPNGEIVDPTVLQFEGQDLWYEPFEPGDAVRIGRCMSCGEPIYASVNSLDDPRPAKSFCDDSCYADFALDLGVSR